jgi:hypothetical protein
MQKLSRLDKNKAARQNAADQTAGQSAKQVRQAAPGHADARRGQTSQNSSEVIENVLGEVFQYNAEHGNTVSDDQQMQILYEINEDKEMDSKRSEHLETMEANENAGGTTRNIYASDLEEVSKAAARAAAAKEEPSEEVVLSAADQQEGEQPFILFTQQSAAAADTVSEEEEQPKKKEKKSIFGRNKEQRSPMGDETAAYQVAIAQTLDDGEDSVKKDDAPKSTEKTQSIYSSYVKPEEDDSGVSSREADEKAFQKSQDSRSKVINVCLALLAICLIGAIAWTLYMVSQLGVFG